MSITCKICNTKFEKIISWQHLKTHNISSADYKIQYGQLYSDETLQKHALKVPHNKGKKITDKEQLDKLKDAIKKRELRFQNGEFTRGAKKTIEQKKVLSLKSKEYAKNNSAEIQNRAKKATQTKKLKNLPGPMTGKRHTAEAKLKISKASKEFNIKKTQYANVQILENIRLADLELINEVNNTSLLLKCVSCSTEFPFTKQYFHKSKFKKELCPTCFPRTINKSKGEQELYEFILSLNNTAISGYRKTYHTPELDIFIPVKNIGFEYNGLYWHSELVLLSNNRSPQSDYEKYLQYKTDNIQVISVFEDEWINKKNIVKSRIRNILGITDNKIYARKCVVKEIDSETASAFCNSTHIMGKGRSNFRVGLFYNNTLVSVMTFTKNNISRKSNTWEINRFSSLLDTTIIGGASKLFSFFIKKINPDTVISYADNRWSNGNLYSVLGFEQSSAGVPNYWYFLPNTNCRIHRYNLRKNSNDNPSLTEWDNRQQQGYNRIWDCGSSKWEWKK